MNQNLYDIDILIGKCISGNATSEEISSLKVWKAASPENLKTYNTTVNAWRKSKNWLPNSQVQTDKATLQQEMNKRLSLQVYKLRRNSQLFKIAAVLAFPIALALSWFVFQNINNEQQQAQFCEISAPKGHVSKCILPDGSEVWINTNSSISYNTTTFNKTNREIEVSGEAFFKVSKDKRKPFVVKNSLADIVVTGTEFNVKSYPGFDIFETVLAEGNIELHLKSTQQQIIELAPGEHAVFNSNKKEVKINKVDPDIYSSWRNGEILFKDATLKDLIVELERIYDIRFHLDEEDLGKYRFRGMFSYNNNLIDALEKIKKTAGMDYYIENKEVWIRSKNSK